MAGSGQTRVSRLKASSPRRHLKTKDLDDEKLSGEEFVGRTATPRSKPLSDTGLSRRWLGVSVSEYIRLSSITLACTFLAFPPALSACSDTTDPPPSGGAPGVGGASSGAGGAAAGKGGAGAGMGGAAAGTGGAAAGTGGAAAGTGGAAAGSAGAGSPGDPVQGKAKFTSLCSSCHGPTADGGIGPNITGSMTAGIGAWGEAAFTKAVREAIGKNGEKFCALMVAYDPGSLRDADLKNVYAYLMSVKSDTANRGTGCP
jgi:mono/diheme cytochrome c family protein